MKPKDGPLLPEELESAENHWITESQKSLKDRLMKGELGNLSPYVHRFRWHRPSWWPSKQCLSVLRNQASRVTPLITCHVHQCGHTGIATTLGKTR